MVTGTELYHGSWHNVPALIQEIDDYYQNNVVGIDIVTATAKKIIERRKWEPAQPFFEENLALIVKELGIRYIPKQLKLGPGILFPLYDHNRRTTHAKFNPFYDVENASGGGLMKYIVLGKEKDERNHGLFGQSYETVLNILKFKSVVFVEGYYDLLACRILNPSAPVLSSGTKSINSKQIWFCQMACAEKVYVMFDKDSIEEEGKKAGAGKDAARRLAERIPIEYPGMAAEDAVSILTGDDPSDCLKVRTDALKLKRSLDIHFTNEVSEVPQIHPYEA